jgi:hypothetical protein
MTKVVHCRKAKFDYYCGRKFAEFAGSPLGNPFHEGYDGTREEVIEMFRNHFREKMYADDDFRDLVLSLKDKTLGCWCKPQSCHCDVIAEYLNKL